MMKRDCFAWEGLKSGVEIPREMSAFPELDQIEREIDQLAHDILADPRRVEAMRRDCPTMLKEVEARAPTPPRPEVSSLAEPTGLARSFRDLSDEQFATIEEVVAGERARRNATTE